MVYIKIINVIIIVLCGKMILSVYLKNWRSHKETKINFGNGINVIHGIIGSGKSSIMDAISFALFGTFPLLQSKKIKLSQLISNFGEDKKALVELEFIEDGKRYVVRREIDNNSTSSYLFYNKSLLQTQTNKVTEEIEKILGINYELFSRAIYSEQNGLEYFLNLSPSQRKSAMDELLGLDKFESARGNIVSIINRLKDEKEKQIEELKGLNEEGLETELKEIKTKIENLEKEHALLLEDLKKNEIEIKELEREKIEKSNLLQKKQELEKECSVLKGQLSSIQTQIEKMPKIEKEKVLKELEKVEKSEKEKKNEIEIKNKEFLSINKKIGEYEEKLRQAEEKKREMEENKNKIKELEEKNVEEEYKKIEERSREIKSEISSITGFLKDVEIALQELKKEITKCPICETPLSSSKRKELLEKKEKEREEANEKIFSKEKELKSVEEELERFKRLKEELELRRNKIKTLYFEEPSKIEELLKVEKEKVTKIEEEIKEREKEFEEINKEKNSLENTLRKIEDIENLIKEKNEIEIKLKEKESEIEKIKVKKEDVEILNEKLKIKSSEKAKKEERKNGISNLIKELKNEEKIAEEQLLRIKRKKAEVEIRNKTIEELSKFESSLLKTQEGLRKFLIESINQKMQEIWEELYPYGDFSEIKIEASEDDYELLLKNLDGDWVSFNLVSGGERSLAALTMRMAISLVLVPKLSWIILDEPTHNMDRNSVELMSKVFREKVSKMVEQVFIITHDEILKEAATSKLILLERDKKNNLPTIVKEHSF
ncbi:MAG: AAA family ATPase [Candidatus Micrarchaeia archaeon]